MFHTAAFEFLSGSSSTDCPRFFTKIFTPFFFVNTDITNIFFILHWPFSSASFRRADTSPASPPQIFTPLFQPLISASLSLSLSIEQGFHRNVFHYIRAISPSFVTGRCTPVR